MDTTEAMKPPRALRNRAAASKQAARMNELSRVIRADQPGQHGFEHRDGFSTTERSWQREDNHLHIGFRAND